MSSRPAYLLSACTIALMMAQPLHAQQASQAQGAPNELIIGAYHAGHAKEARRQNPNLPKAAPSPSWLLLGGLVVGGLAAATSGGSDEDSRNPSTGPVPDPIIAPPLAPELRESVQDITASREYRINSGLVSSRAAFKYAQGLTGKGVRIAVMDSGIQSFESLDKKVKRQWGYSAIDRSYIDNRAGLRHGTAVAQIIAGRRDEQGSHGIAYDAELVDIAVLTEDFDSSQFADSRELTPGLRAAVNAKAHIVNVSLGIAEYDPNESVAFYRNELRRIGISGGLDSLANSDTVMVVSTGNDGTNDLNIIAASGLLDEYKGHVLAVASINGSDSISSFSNRCSRLQDFCLSAVGEELPVFDQRGQIVGFTGTSGSAPLVSGSLALLKQEFPELSMTDNAKTLLLTARDLGRPGVDEVYGHGALDLSSALQPVGSLSIQSGTSVSGPSYRLDESVITTNTAMQGAVQSALMGVDITLTDALTRGFETDITNFVSYQGQDNPLPALSVYASHDNVSVQVFGEDSTLGSYHTGTARHSIGYGQSDIFADALMDQDVRKGYSMLSVLDKSLNLSTQRHSLGLSYGAGLALDNDGQAVWAEVARYTPRANRFIRLGYVQEEGRVLGARFEGAMGGSAKARSAFIEAGGRLNLTSAWSLGTTGQIGYTDFSQDGIVKGGDMLTASARLSAHYKDAYDNTWGAFIGTPLVAHKGSLSLDVPSDRSPSEDGETSDGLLRTQIDADFQTSSVPLDLGLDYQRDFKAASVKASVGVRHHDSQSSPFAGIGITMKF